MLRRLSDVVRSVAPLTAGVAILCGVACASPTLPLPPPEAPTQTPGVDAEHVELTAGCGGAQGGADIIIINQTVEATMPDQEVGVVSLASACGAWKASVFARSGDVLQISQEAGTLASDATIYTVR
jgi:hypothetical protein